jgi:hypothetical protein
MEVGVSLAADRNYHNYLKAASHVPLKGQGCVCYFVWVDIYVPKSRG